MRGPSQPARYDASETETPRMPKTYTSTRTHAQTLNYNKPSLQITIHPALPHHHNLLLIPSSLNFTSFNIFPMGFHSSNSPNNISTSLSNSFFTNSSSSKPRIAQGRKNGFGFVVEADVSYSLTLSLYTSLVPFCLSFSFSPTKGILIPVKLPAVPGLAAASTGSDVVSSACCTASAYTAESSYTRE
jgi:hypothetical protein